MAKQLNAGAETAGRPRLAPQRSFPPYSYVPGHGPHPVSHPQGHMHGRPEPADAAPLDPDQWSRCESYLFGLDLFNHGYYWEAHETWEALWHAAGRTGPKGDFLKALIKLAAAAVKAREGSATGAARHAARCRELVESVQAAQPASREVYAGLTWEQICTAAIQVERSAEEHPMPEAVFDVILLPRPIP